MPVIPFEKLPANARLWVFPASRPLDDPELHGVPLTAGRETRYGQFLLVGVDEAAAGVSGCSIDALVRCLREFEWEIGVRLTDHGPVLYRAGGSIDRVPRAGFRQLAEDGRVDRGTTVFDSTVQTVGALRAGQWERAAGDSWHRAMLPDPAVVRESERDPASRSGV
jgi:hypothetical protein